MLSFRSLVLFLCCVAVALAMTCHNVQHNIRGLPEAEKDTIVTCGEGEEWCAYMTGNQKNGDKSEKFLFRGCANRTHGLDEYNAVCNGESKLTILHGDTTGTLYCCDTNNCNPASFAIPSIVLLASVFCLSFFL
uniref:UPAR/Ly6 domain-containing protein n=1 Tax=Panagrellus redivivus TaxID=6233 RepID=A0A7E4W473_PANRE